MSLSTASNRVVATGDGVTVTFYFNRLLYDATHLQVYLAGVLQTSGYTVAGVPGTATSVTFSVAPTNGAQVLLLRVVPLTQLSVYAVGGAFPAATTEKNFDLAFMGLQQFDEINDRAVTLPVTSTLTAADIPDPALPANYGKGIKIKGDGTGLDTFDMSATPYTSPLTTKGDLAVYSTTPDRLPVGTNGQVIVADSTTGLGVKWSGDLSDNVLRIVGSADATKKVAFEVDGIATGTTRTVTIPNNDVDLTLVRAGSDTQTGVLELATQAEVNAMTDTTRVLTPNHNLTVLGTLSTTTSGTAFDYTIPAGARRVTISFSEVSLSGTDDYLVQLGDAGGVEVTGYVSTSTNVAASANSTSGFIVKVTNAALVASGHMVLTVLDSATFSWASSHTIKTTTNLVVHGGGSKALSAELTTVRVTRSGTDTFDAGTLNVSIER